MESDKTLLRLIDDEIARLQATRAEITTRLGLDKSTNVALPPLAREGKGKSAKSPNSNGSAKTSRRGEISDFLKSNGPATTGEILKGTGMPRGSVGFTLTRNDEFERLQDGRWNLKRH